MHFLELVFYTLKGIVRAVSFSLRRGKQVSSVTELIESVTETKLIAEVIRPVVAVPETIPVNTESEKMDFQRPLKEQENTQPSTFNKQNSIFNQTRRVDSPAKKRKSKQQQQQMPEEQSEMIIVTKSEVGTTGKKGRSESKRMASPSPKVEKVVEVKPPQPENWYMGTNTGDEVDMCKAAVLLTMLNDADEDMMCGMIQKMTSKSARQILEHRGKHGPLGSMAQLDAVCHKGFSGTLLKAN